MNFMSVVKSVAPGIAGLFGGPFGAVGMKAAIEALSPDENIDGLETEELLAPILEKLVSKATPEKLQNLTLAQDKVRAEMAKYNVEVVKTHAGDRANARDREIKTGDDYPKYLASGIWATLFIEIMIIIILDRTLDGLIASLVGAHAASAVAVTTYYFGSSKGSSDKTKLLSQK